MNSFVLLAKIVRSPELRYTQESQTPVAEMMVEFPGTRPEESNLLKVVGWGSLANEISEKYHLDDQVVIEGRLSIKTYDNPEGFKEKKAEMIASRVYGINGGIDSTGSYTPSSAEKTSSPREPLPINSASFEPTRTENIPSVVVEEEDLPF